MRITSPSFSEAVTLTPSVIATDKGFRWHIQVEGWPGANPQGGGSTIMARPVENQSGECGSAHEAEFRAAAALVEMAAEQRSRFAMAELRLATRNSANAAALAASERLAAIEG